MRKTRRRRRRRRKRRTIRNRTRRRRSKRRRTNTRIRSSIDKISLKQVFKINNEKLKRKEGRYKGEEEEEERN